MRKKWITVLLGILTSVILGSLLLVAQGFNPLESYASIIQYSLGSLQGVTNTLNRLSILILTSSSAAIALGSGVDNLGQFGQLLTGGFASFLIGYYVPLPNLLLIPLMIIGAMVVGALFAGIAGFLRVKFGMSEFITTLMLNFIGDLLIRYLVTYPFADPQSNWPMSRVLTKGILPSVSGVDFAFVIAILVYIFLIIYTSKSIDGYEFKMMGRNSLFSKVGGVKTEKNFWKVIFISGALAGLGGALLIMGASQQNRFLPGIGEVFYDDGLMVAIVSNFSMLGLMIYSFIFSILQTGSTGMQLETGVPAEFIQMLIAVTVISIVAFRSYSQEFLNKIKLRKESRKLKEYQKDSDGKGYAPDEYNN